MSVIRAYPINLTARQETEDKDSPIHFLMTFGEEVTAKMGPHAAQLFCSFVTQVLNLPKDLPQPLEQWHEDFGPVLWWKFPLDEPPFAGTPLDSDWPGYHTHWTRIPIPKEPAEDSQTGE